MRERAREFLAALLEAGPRTSREVWEAAQRQGLADRTLTRAKRELAVRSVRVSAGVGVRTYWLLPGQQMEAPDAPPDLEQWLAPLRERFPPSTPLDD
jgi:hypothetical protein